VGWPKLLHVGSQCGSADVFPPAFSSQQRLSSDTDSAPSPHQSAPAASVPDGDAPGLIEAGQKAERSGHREEARAFFERALYRLSGESTGSQAAALLRWIARTYVMDANTDAAMDCASAALAVAQACGDKVGEGHAINVQATIYWTHGDLDAAEGMFLSARTCALNAGEPALVAMTSQNLGTIANIRGDLPDALHHYDVALENYRTLNRPHEVCTALNNMGRLCTDMKRWSEAERAYAEAIRIANELGDASTRIGLEVNVAEMWLTRGNSDEAADALDDATQLTATTGDTVWIGHLAKLRGILYRGTGAAQDAERHLTEAAELAETRQDSLLLAEVLRERAELYRGQGRNREALQNLNRAHRLFTQFRAKRELANVDQSVSRLEDDFINVVEKWGESIEAKDRYTQGHCVRVADLSCAIAAAFGIEGQSLFWFRVGAMLHDVGKLVVPSEVLNKPGKLDEAEWEVMRSHTTAGVDMLAGIDFPWDVRPLIESHHERWDGKGYPHGLSGESIPLSARILAVADVYDALTSLRSYKAAMSHETAMGIMRRDSGTAFDPGVFAKFEEIVRDGTTPVATLDFAQIVARDEGERRMSLESSTDPVTGLPLRDSMLRIMAQELADRHTTNGNVALVAFQVDRETPAWQAMSKTSRRRVLRSVARELRTATRTTDFLATTGKRQFMALLPGSSRRQARAVVVRVQRGLVRRLRRIGIDHRVALTMGTAVATAPEDGHYASDLFERAEASLVSGHSEDGERATGSSSRQMG
jgi:diguanylate cyclase (GGDEF)-like protein/putative nucleotidyltransferase with HDIG domain